MDVVEHERLEVPQLSAFEKTLKGSGGREASTTISASRTQSSQLSTATTGLPRSSVNFLANAARLSGLRECTRISSNSKKWLSSLTFQ